MKKFTQLAVLILLSIGILLTVAACGNNDQNLVDDALENLKVTLGANDTALKTAYGGDNADAYGDIVISFESENTAVISNTGAVTRSKTAVDVNVKVILTLNNAKAERTDKITVTASSALVSAYLDEALATVTLPTTATTNITLPTLDAQYSDITLSMSSSDPAVISNTGVVTGKLGEDSSIKVTVTAKVGTSQRSKEFTVSVPGRVPTTEADKALVDAASIVIPAVAIANITLPTTGTYGSTIAWASSSSSRLSTSGVVSRQASSDTRVTMTATVTNGTATETRYIDVTVLRTNNSATGVFALSSKNTPLYYLTLEGGKVYLSTSGFCFVNSAATERKIEFAFAHTAETGFDYATCPFNDGTWYQNTKPANGMEYSFKVDVSEAYKTVSTTDWIKFYIKVTEKVGDTTVTTYLRTTSGSANGVSTVTTGGSGNAASWATGATIQDIVALTDSNGKTFTLRVQHSMIYIAV